MPAWYYARNSQQLGPVTFEELQGMAAQGQLTPADLVWTDGMPQWKPAAQIQGLIIGAAPIYPPNAPLPAYPPQQVGYAGPYYAPPSQHAGLAMTSMIMSLVSIVFLGPLLSIPGAICGWVALRGMKRTGDLRNRGFALTGLWVGIGWTVVYVVIVIVVVIAVIASKKP